MKKFRVGLIGCGVLATLSACASSPSNLVTDRTDLGESPASYPATRTGSAAHRQIVGAVTASCTPLRRGAFVSLVQPSSPRLPTKIVKVPDPRTNWSWVVARYTGRGTAAWLVGPPSARPRVYAGDDLARSVTPTAPRDAQAPVTTALRRDDAAACL